MLARQQAREKELGPLNSGKEGGYYSDLINRIENARKHKLTTLDLSGGTNVSYKFSTLPQSVMQLTELRSLDLSYNDLSELPETFRITQEQVEEIREQADAGQKVEPVFSVDVLDEGGQAIARVEKLLYIRKKNGR